MAVRSILCLLVGFLALGLGFQSCLISAQTERERSQRDAEASPSLSDPSRFAVLIGVDDYAQPEDSGLRIIPLKGPRNDVDAMKALLTQVYKFPNDKEHIVALIGKQATRAAITNAFKDGLIGNAKKYKENGNKEATVVFYFSGHGSQTEDTNGDEGDGLDETLVAYDSRAKGGHDIVDDEIDEWFQELRKYTGNITFILDSCHSGSATRALLPESLVAKELAPDRRPQPPQKPIPPEQKAGIGSRDLGNGILPRNQAYVAISGALPEELSYEADLKTDQGTKRHGLLTYHLVNTLRATPRSTYLDAIKIVRNQVSQRSSQHPQVEGDIDRVVFGGPADREDPFIAILQAPQDKKFTIDAGAIHGLQVGTFVAIYDSQAEKLIGEDHKLANARVVEVNDFTSVAELSDDPRSPVSTDAKVRIVTPAFGMRRLSMNVATLPEQQMTAHDQRLLEDIKGLLKQNNLVELVTTPSTKNWTVAIQRGCITENGPLVVGQNLKASDANCKPVYYLAPRDVDYPLLGLVLKADDSALAEELVGGIEALAKQENLRGLTNALSPLNGKLKISLVKVEVGQGPQGSRLSNPNF